MEHQRDHQREQEGSEREVVPFQLEYDYDGMPNEMGDLKDLKSKGPIHLLMQNI